MLNKALTVHAPTPPPPKGKNVDLVDSYDMQIEPFGQTEVT